MSPERIQALKCFYGCRAGSEKTKYNLHYGNYSFVVILISAFVPQNQKLD